VLVCDFALGDKICRDSGRTCLNAWNFDSS